MKEHPLYMAGRAYAREQGISVRHYNRAVPWAKFDMFGKARQTFDGGASIVVQAKDRGRLAGLILAHELGHTMAGYAWSKRHWGDRGLVEYDAWRRAFAWIRANGFRVTRRDRDAAATWLATYAPIARPGLDAYVSAVRWGIRWGTDE